MAEEVKVLSLGKGEYAAEVHEAREITQHKVLLPQVLLDSLDTPDPDERRCVAESVRYLLEKSPSTALPHDIDLERVQTEDSAFLPELNARMAE